MLTKNQPSLDAGSAFTKSRKRSGAAAWERSIVPCGLMVSTTNESQSSDIRVIECCEYLAFVAKSFYEIRSIQTDSHQLDCDSFVVLTISPHRTIDLSHAATPDFLLDFVNADPASNEG